MTDEPYVSPRGALPTGAMGASSRQQFSEADARMAARIADEDRAKRLAAQKRDIRSGRFKR